MSVDNGSPRSGPGDSYVSVVGIAFAVALLVIVAALLIYDLIALWPPMNAGQPGNATVTHHVFGLSVQLNQDQGLFVVVSLAGALGGVIHALRSLYWYIGSRQLKRSWLAFYICVPFVGAALSIVFFLVLRGGLISGQATASANVYGFAGIGALVGLFSAQAAQKLKEIFTVLFAAAEKGVDTAETKSATSGTQKGNSDSGE